MSGRPSTSKCSTVLALNKSRGILVDAEDEWLLEKYVWHIGTKGYAYTNIVLRYGGEGERKRAYTALHHCIMGQPIWKGDEIDHRDRCPNNNRRSNLRYLSKGENTRNTNRALPNAGFRNITIRPNGRYQVVVTTNGVNHYLGVFDTLDEAVAERDQFLWTR